MNGAFRHISCGLILITAYSTTVYSKPASCHLHAPADYPTFTKQPLIIPAVGNESECVKLNRERFSSRGRCHCIQDSTDESRPYDLLEQVRPPERLL